MIQIATFQENMDSPAMIDQSMYASAVDSVEKLKLDEDTESRHSPLVHTYDFHSRFITYGYGVHGIRNQCTLFRGKTA